MLCVWVLQRGHRCDGCDLASTLCKYDLRKGDLFVLSWASMRRVRRGSISSKLLMCGGGVRSILLLPLVARCIETILRIHVTSPILGERISAITLTQQCKQWLSVELNHWRSETIHCYFYNNKNRTLIFIM